MVSVRDLRPNPGWVLFSRAWDPVYLWGGSLNKVGELAQLSWLAAPAGLSRKPASLTDVHALVGLELTRFSLG